jgi:hypothetical protein
MGIFFARISPERDENDLSGVFLEKTYSFLETFRS